MWYLGCISQLPFLVLHFSFSHVLKLQSVALTNHNTVLYLLFLMRRLQCEYLLQTAKFMCSYLPALLLYIMVEAAYRGGGSWFVGLLVVIS